MKKKVSKKEALEIISEFFSKSKFNPEELGKIKKIAMSHKIKLGKFRRMFCKNCLFPLEGKTRISGGFRTVECGRCGFINRHKIRPS